MLLKAALEALGAEVDMFLARMRLGAKPGVVRPRSHLLLRVSENGASWHADVGFARGILEPIPFGPGPTQEQSGWSFRVVEEGSELVLQKLAGEEGPMFIAFSHSRFRSLMSKPATGGPPRIPARRSSPA
jgi:N-hydroxyarylamine O-acetyltransferase